MRLFAQMVRLLYFWIITSALVLFEFEIRDWRWTRTKSLTILLREYYKRTTNLQFKTQLLTYDKGAFLEKKKLSPPEGRLRIVRKTEPEEILHIPFISMAK